MGEVIRVKDQFYVLASSALADDRTRVLKYGDTFAVLNRYGDITALGQGQFGVFHAETRHLSRMVLRLNRQEPLLLSSTVREDNAFLSVDVTNMDRSSHGEILVPRGAVHIYRSKFLNQAVCYEQLRLMNYSVQPVEISLLFQFDADFADIFEVRGAKRERRGQRLPDRIEDDSVVLAYQGLDGVQRRTRIRFTPAPDSLSTRKARFDLKLEPKEEEALYVTVACERNESTRHMVTYHAAFHELTSRLEQAPLHDCRVTTSSKRFNAWLARSEADLLMMIEGNPEGPYPYAGVPWFNTIFGRDGIITAMECLWVAPWISEGVLKYLAQTQATAVIPEQDAEPGKILHEMRRGEMAVLKEVPFGCYYGSVDATPLFIMLAGGYFLRTNNVEFLRDIWPNIERALQWIDKYGDADGDGFVEYSRRSKHGLVQQGWKDSSDSVFHADSRLADPPIALCEVQAYVYAAKKSAAIVARALGKMETAERLDLEAVALQKRFEASFWNDDLGLYALALDGKKQQCRVRTSNAGHALFCTIADRRHAEITARTLLSESLFSGWGIRTVAAGEARYNPMSYHNGSVWPHDNAIVALGLSLYGFQEQAVRVLYGLYEASLYVDLHRLPELFCGFHKRRDTTGPTLYPVACAPQSWAAGAVYLLLRACLGVTIRAQEKQIRFVNPVLPPNLEVVRIENLRVGHAVVDLIVKSHFHGVAVEVLRKEGDLEIVKSV